MIELGLRGMQWQIDPYLLGAGYAQEAHNCYRRDSGLRPLRRGRRSTREPTRDMSIFRTLYLHDEKLIATEDKRTFVTTPVVQDSARRVYFIEGGTLQYLPKHEINDGLPTRTTALGHAAALPTPAFPPYLNGGIGVPVVFRPNPTPPPENEDPLYTQYVVTFVDKFGAETQPSYPSVPRAYYASEGITYNVVFGWQDSHPDIVGLRLYMAINNEYFLVSSPRVSYPGDGTPYTTPIDDLTALFDLTNASAGNATILSIDVLASASNAGTRTLQTVNFDPPPVGMKDITALDNGMVVGWDDHTLYYNEPYLMHVWPVEYQWPIEGTIQSVAKLSAGHVVITDRDCHFFVGNTPTGLQETTRSFRYPCTDPDSVTIVDDGVVYLSTEGIVLLSATQSLIITDGWIDREALRDNVTFDEAKCEVYEGRILMATRRPDNNDPIGYCFNLAERDITSFDLHENAMKFGFWRDPQTNDVCYVDDLPGLGIFNSGDRLVAIWESSPILIPNAINYTVAQVDAELYPAPPDAIEMEIMSPGRGTYVKNFDSHKKTRIRGTGRAREITVRLQTGVSISRARLLTGLNA